MRRASLVIIGGGFAGNRFEIVQPAVLIGRTPTSELQLVDDGVSREHAVISWEDDHYAIEDLQSTNGTHVNGKRVGSAELREGDEIQVGSTVFLFRLD